MKIGELAKLAQVPTSTIRFYEQSGLLPAARRTQSGYRDYDQSTLQQIQMIQFCQGLGFSLQELPGLLTGCDGVDHEHVMKQLEQKLAETDEVISQLQQNRQRMASLMTRLTQLWDKQECMDADELASLISASNVRVPVKVAQAKKQGTSG